MSWNEVKDEKDIETLLKTYCGFHDSCIASAKYDSAMYTDEEKTMWFGDPEDYSLNLIFHSQWDPQYIELRFEGVRRFRLIGFQDNYTSDIYGAFIKFCDDLLLSGHFAPSRSIVWSDCEFDESAAGEDLCEPACSYIIAGSLKWRILSNGGVKRKNKE